MRRKNGLKEKFNPPVLDSDDDADEQELLRQAMADVTPIRRRGDNRSDRSPLRLRRDSSAGRVEVPEQPLLEFMKTTKVIESRHRPGYVEGGSLKWNRRLIRKLRRGDFSVQEDLDLHGFSEFDARRELELFLRESTLRGFSCVRVVHGKGKNSPGRESILKKRVPEWLGHRRNARYVAAFTSAPIRDGGSGATYVLLRPGLSKPAPPRRTKPPRRRNSN